MLLRIWAIARKEFIQIVRDWRTLAVVILLPVVLLVLYGYGINMDVKHIRTAVLDQDNTAASRDLIGAFKNTDYFDIVEYLGSSAEIDHTIERAEARMALVIPRGYTRDLASGRRAQVQIIVDGSDSTAATAAINYVTALLSGYSGRITLAAASRMGLTRSDVLQPIDYRPRVWYNPELRSTIFIVPGLIAVILMMLSALLTSMTIVRERERGTLEQLVVSPIMPSELMIGKIIPYAIIAFFDIILVTAAGRVFFEVPLNGSAALLTALAAVFLVAALGIGLLISTIAGSQQTAMTIALLTALLPSILLSGFAFPIASMPKAIQLVTYLIPARYFLVIARGIFLKGVGLSVLWPQAAALVVFAALAVWASARRFKKQV